MIGPFDRLRSFDRLRMIGPFDRLRANGSVREASVYGAGTIFAVRE